MERDGLKHSVVLWVLGGPVGQGGNEISIAAFIASQRTEQAVPHALTCQALGLSESGFYKWRDRAPTARLQRRADLDAAIRAAFDASGGTMARRGSRSSCANAGGRSATTRSRRGWPRSAWPGADLNADAARPSKASGRGRRTGSAAGSLRRRRPCCRAGI
jgi:hypothetical protein